jgi:hypothetical protein
MALRLWAVGRVIEVSWEICGENSLGINPINDPSNPWHNTVPITPLMDTQLDQIAIKAVLDPLKAEVLAKLNEKIYLARPEDWMEIYLCVFILLSHVEMLAAHSNRFARRYGMPVRYPGNSQSQKMLSQAALPAELY